MNGIYSTLGIVLLTHIRLKNLYMHKKTFGEIDSIHPLKILIPAKCESQSLNNASIRPKAVSIRPKIILFDQRPCLFDQKIFYSTKSLFYSTKKYSIRPKAVSIRPKIVLFDQKRCLFDQKFIHSIKNHHHDHWWTLNKRFSYASILPTT